MRSVRFEKFGEPREVLAIRDVPAPEPGPGEVALRLTHRPINPSDLAVVRGTYGRLPSPPATPGLEAMGTISALGDGVSGLAIGQRVIPLGARGTWSEVVVCGAQQLLPVPDAVPDEAAAQFVVNPVTAWAMIVDELGLGEGDWLLQTAAGSTLGRLVLQLAPMLGIRTVNLVRRPEQVDELLALGADAAFATTTPNLDHAIGTLTGGGVAGAIEAVGGQTGKIAISCLQPGASVLLYGWLGLRPLPLNVGELLFKGLTVKGFWLTTWFQQRPPEHVQRSLQTLMGHFASGKLSPPIEATYDLEDVVAAAQHAERPGRAGKVLLTG